MKKWTKVSRIFCPENNFPWMKTHASNPVADHLEGSIFRIYFSTRKEENISSIAFVDIDLNDPTKILNISEKPVLEPGALGLFDDSGVSMACILNYQGDKYLYYLGWNIMAKVPWHNSIGVAKQNKTTGEFEKMSLAPLLDRNDADPYSLSYPYVLEDGDVFRIYYGSNLSWGSEQKDMAHLMKYAQGNTPFEFNREGHIALPFEADNEYAMSKPCVIKDDDSYKLWYSFRGESYRIGYAESQDGVNWQRKDSEVGITVSDDGWDSQTVEYPFVFDHDGKRFMLYNGNSYGLTGFGLAYQE
jgi:predicted GH43/DUF377 family glycosyl hydrolase